jgi:hypothetical protein
MATSRLGTRNDPPQEYVILVGGPSNTFNGYIFDNLTPSTPPVDSSAVEVKKYTRGTVAGRVPGTHDRYWANFIYAAVKLVETGRMRPQPGDILTLIVYLPGFYLRTQKDWRASPFNPKHWQNGWVYRTYPYSPYSVPPVADASQGAKPDSAAINGVQPIRNNIYVEPYPRDSNNINLTIFMLEINDMKTGPNAPDPPHPEMPDGGFPRLSRDPSEHMNLILNIPARLAFGSRYFFGSPPDGVRDNIPPLRDVTVKMLFIDDDLSKFYDYLTLGAWTGPRYRLGMQRGGSEGEEASPHQPLFNVTWGPGGAGESRRVLSVSMTLDGDGNPSDGATWSAWVPPYLLGTDTETNPAVDRSRVKIKQFHYFGHSGGDGTLDYLYLRYGWDNRKGEYPAGELYIPRDTLQETLSNAPEPIFSDQSLAKLWGCHLAKAAPDDSITRVLGNFATKSIGSNGYVDYAPVIDAGAPDAMPAPSGTNATWLTFP